MSEFNNYPVFVADQVLTADHLNEIVNYLEEQERLSRNKLIGIGIVCGLELKVSATQIDISKGCGITSEGYLIVQDNLSLTHYQPYEVPADFFPKYKPVYDEVTSVNDSVEWTKYELLTTVQSLDIKNPIALTSAFLQNNVVVLLLEMRESPLKNCVDTDCDDKGEKIQFSVKPLLVDKADIDSFLKLLATEKASTNSSSQVEPVLQHIELKRINVPVKELKGSVDVYNAFRSVTDDATLKALADNLNYCYIHYKSILPEELINPFSSVYNTFINLRPVANSPNEVCIQYYYDWIDDLIKAYYEFKQKVFEIQNVCCPDEDLFPLHLMLGKATVSSSTGIHSDYRNYFICSALFNNQSERLAEVQLLFRRMKMMVSNFVFPGASTLGTAAMKITPSKYLDKTLSDGAIPYYYNPIGLYQCWSWNKTRKGNENFNLSYNAAQYNSLPAIQNPLLYDIERFNFFRIEGLIGKGIAAALSKVTTERDDKNLPFDVVALSTAVYTYLTEAGEYDCMVKDLESAYQVLLSELLCKFRELTCFLASTQYELPKISQSIDILIISNGIKTGEALKAKASGFPAIIMMAKAKKVSSSFTLAPVPTGYQRGDYLKSSKCAIDIVLPENVQSADPMSTIGAEYLKGVPYNVASTSDYSHVHYLYLLDCIDQVMNAAFPSGLENISSATLADFNSWNFNAKWDAFTTEIKNFLAKYILKTPGVLSDTILVSQLEILLNSCFDDQFTALNDEYQKRIYEIKMLKNIDTYFKKHPGMDHKAGVSKDGTFILLYDESDEADDASVAYSPVIADFFLPYRCCSDCG